VFPARPNSLWGSKGGGTLEQQQTPLELRPWLQRLGCGCGAQPWLQLRTRPQ
jgi:hypothetical protein